MNWPAFLMAWVAPGIAVGVWILWDYLTTRRRQETAWRMKWQNRPELTPAQAYWQAARIRERQQRDRVRAIHDADHLISEDTFAGEARRAVKEAIVMLEAT